jgi:hypothetical protein
MFSTLSTFTGERIMKLLNSFSLNMLPRFPLMVRFTEWTSTTGATPPFLEKMESCIGHEDLARLIGVKCNRCSVTLALGEIFLVAQYIGPRLPEGTTVLPEGSHIKWIVGIVDL